MDDAVDAQQTTSSPAPTPEETPTADGDGETEPDAADGETPAGDGDGPTVIGGAETGLTLEIPDEWVDLPTDAARVSEAVGNRDLTDDQAAFIESWLDVLSRPDGGVMAVDLNNVAASVATTASVATIINAYCAPNDGRIGRQDPAATPTPLRKDDLEEMVELSIRDTFGTGAVGTEVGSTTVDGYAAAQGTYTLDMPSWVSGVLAGAAGVGVEYMLLADDDVCWVTFTGADESSFGLFDDIAATIDVL